MLGSIKNKKFLNLSDPLINNLEGLNLFNKYLNIYANITDLRNGGK